MSLFERIGKWFGTGSDTIGEVEAPPSVAIAPVNSTGTEESHAGGDEEMSQSDAELQIECAEPAEDAKVCQISLNRKVSPVGTVLFESVQDAEGWPLIQGIFSVEGVHSVIAKESVIIVSRKAEAGWSDLLPKVKAVLEEKATESPSLSDDPQAQGSPAPETVWIKEGQDVAPRSAPAATAPTTGGGEADDASVPPEVTEKIRIEVEEILVKEINPFVASHGGVISLLDVRGSRVFIHMGGGCQGCGSATATLKLGVESTIRTKIPEVTEILDTTDHAAGTNPYFAPSGH